MKKAYVEDRLLAKYGDDPELYYKLIHSSLTTTELGKLAPDEEYQRTVREVKKRVDKQ